MEWLNRTFGRVAAEDQNQMKCRGLAVALAGLVTANGMAVAGSDDWMTDFEKAKAKAAERNVPILADFSGSDWCGWCIKLDKEVFSKEAFTAYAKDSLVLFLADFPMKKELPDAVKQQNETLSKRYGIEGYPTVLLLDKNGRELARTGYQKGGAKAYVEHLKELIAKQVPAAPAAKPAAAGG